MPRPQWEGGIALNDNVVRLLSVCLSPTVTHNLNLSEGVVVALCNHLLPWGDGLIVPIHQDDILFYFLKVVLSY